MSERNHYSIAELAAKYSVSPQTIEQLITQNSIKTIIINGILRLWDPWEDPKTGTNTAEDIYILRGSEVAEILGITTRALRYLVAGGGMPGHESRGGQIGCVFVGRQRRYSLADVRRLIAKRMKKKVSGKRGPRVRTAIVEWALERLTTMDRVRKPRPTHEGSDKKSWQDREFMAKRRANTSK